MSFLPLPAVGTNAAQWLVPPFYDPDVERVMGWLALAPSVILRHIKTGWHKPDESKISVSFRKNPGETLSPAASALLIEAPDRITQACRCHPEFAALKLTVSKPENKPSLESYQMFPRAGKPCELLVVRLILV